MTDRPADIDPADCILLVPQCLREVSHCQAELGEEGWQCRACSASCPVNRLRRAAFEEGFKGVCIAAGGSMAVNYVASHRPKGIVAIACDKELVLGVAAVQSMEGGNKTVIKTVPLLKEGCINTEVDFERALEVIRSFNRHGGDEPQS